MTQMQAIMQAVQAVLAAQNGKAPVKAKGYASKKNARKPKGRQKLTDAEKAVFSAQNDEACRTEFAKRGIQDVKPRVDVLTYKKWREAGRLVKRGEKATRIGNFPLFHISQTEPAPEVIGA